MSSAPHYRAQADLARRLAELTVQPNLKRELRYVAEELDHLANEIGVTIAMSLVAGESVVGALVAKTVPLGT